MAQRGRKVKLIQFSAELHHLNLLSLGRQLRALERGRDDGVDDTYRHEVWNDTDQIRVVLLVQFARPLRLPGRLVAGDFLWGVKQSPFVRDARRNLASWDDAVRRSEAAAQPQEEAA